MFRSLSFLALLLLNFTFVFGSVPSNPNPNLMPPRQDRLDYSSQYAINKLYRARMVLRTIVQDPDSYQLILSNNTMFGAEAVPPGVFASKPTVIVYEGALDPRISTEELAFVLGHELGHLNLHHMERVAQEMDSLLNKHPIQLSGVTFGVFYQKLQEREADLFGYSLYKRAGYDMNLFPRIFHYIKTHPGYDPHMKVPMGPELPTLSMKNPHFSMYERFELLSMKATGSA